MTEKEHIERVLTELRRRLKIAAESYHFSDLAAEEYFRLVKEIEELKSR